MPRERAQALIAEWSDGADRGSGEDGAPEGEVEETRAGMRQLRKIEIELKKQPDQQLSLTDPDARSRGRMRIQLMDATH